MKFSEHKTTAKEYNIGGGEFWRPKKGKNKVRILSEYEAYGYHWDNKTKKGGICIGKDKGCKWCAEGNKPKAKFLMWVIDREDGEIKIAQVGYTTIQQLGSLQTDEDWMFSVAPDYDITITREGEGLDTVYFVQPAPKKTPLKKEEQELVTEKVKDLTEIINRMKEKAGASLEEIQVDEEDVEEPPADEIRNEDIPF